MSNREITYIIPDQPDRGYYYFTDQEPFSKLINFYGGILVSEAPKNKNIREEKNGIFTESDSSKIKQKVEIIKSTKCQNEEKSHYQFERFESEVYFDNWTNKEDCKYFYLFEFLKLNKNYKDFCQLLEKSRRDNYRVAFEIHDRLSKGGFYPISLQPDDCEWERVNRVKIYMEEEEKEINVNLKESITTCPNEWDCNGEEQTLNITISDPFKGSYHCIKCGFKGDLNKEDFYILESVNEAYNYKFLDKGANNKNFEKKSVLTRDLAFTYTFFGNVFEDRYQGERGFFNWWTEQISFLPNYVTDFYKRDWIEILFRYEDGKHIPQICRGAFLFSSFGLANNLQMLELDEINDNPENNNMENAYYIKINKDLTIEDINIQLDKLKRDIHEKHKFKETRAQLMKLRKTTLGCNEIGNKLKAYELHLQNKNSLEIGYHLDIANRKKKNKNKQAKDIRYENSSESTNARQRKQGRMLVNSAKLNIIASIIKFEESMSKISESIELRFPATNE